MASKTVIRPIARMRSIRHMIFFVLLYLGDTHGEFLISSNIVVPFNGREFYWLH